MNTKQEIVKWLKQVSTGEVDLGPYGMCHYLCRIEPEDSLQYDRIMDLVAGRMAKYAVANGTRATYPVPHPLGFGPASAYFEQQDSGNSMNDTSPYGLNRRALAKWLADELEDNKLL